MEKFQEHLQLANKAFQTADHLIYVTYPLVKDIKLLITIIENLYFAATNAMDAVLQFDKYYKRINHLVDNFEVRYDIFKLSCARRYNIAREHVDLISELRSIVTYHKKSPMEFVRNDKFVICSPSYELKTINIEKTKEYLAKIKEFLTKINNAVKKEG